MPSGPYDLIARILADVLARPGRYGRLWSAESTQDPWYPNFSTSRNFRPRRGPRGEAPPAPMRAVPYGENVVSAVEARAAAPATPAAAAPRGQSPQPQPRSWGGVATAPTWTVQDFNQTFPSARALGYYVAGNNWANPGQENAERLRNLLYSNPGKAMEDRDALLLRDVLSREPGSTYAPLNANELYAIALADEVERAMWQRVLGPDSDAPVYGWQEERREAARQRR